MKPVRMTLAWSVNGPKVMAIFGQLVADNPMLPTMTPNNDHYWRHALHFDVYDADWGLSYVHQIREWLKKNHQWTDTTVLIDGFSLEEYIIRLTSKSANVMHLWAETLKVLKKTRHLFPNKDLQRQRLALESKYEQLNAS